jgi:hypothetical protein
VALDGADFVRPPVLEAAAFEEFQQVNEADLISVRRLGH